MVDRQYSDSIAYNVQQVFETLHEICSDGKGKRIGQINVITVEMD